jgi:TatD DNase family protein
MNETPQQLIDTHCHVHDSEFAKKYNRSVDEILQDAKHAGVREFVCVGTDLRSSKEAIVFAANRNDCYATVALHPHEAASYELRELREQMDQLEQLLEKGAVVAVGECGLDYFYHHDEQVKEKQRKLFIEHIKLASKYKLPMVFHIREAFDDFFTNIDKYPTVEGVVHSFSATEAELQGVIKRGFFVGLNGIMTFTKDHEQLAAAKAVPLENLVLETDAPFLTPKPDRGKMCEPKHVINITQFLSELRGESQALLAQQTTKNAKKLFRI